MFKSHIQVAHVQVTHFQVAYVQDTYSNKYAVELRLQNKNIIIVNQQAHIKGPMSNRKYFTFTSN